MRSGLKTVGAVLALGLALSGCKDNSQLNGYYYGHMKTKSSDRLGPALLVYIKDGEVVTGRTMRYPVNFRPEELVGMGVNEDINGDTHGKFKVDGDTLTVHQTYRDATRDWVFKRIGGGKDLVCTNCTNDTRYNDLTSLGEQLDLSKPAFKGFAMHQDNPAAFNEQKK